jgi:hypothetical protein
MILNRTAASTVQIQVPLLLLLNEICICFLHVNLNFVTFSNNLLAICTTLHYTILHYTTLYYTTLHCTTLYYTVLHYSALHCTTPNCTTLHCTTLQCTTLYTTLHCTTLHYTTLHYTIRTVREFGRRIWSRFCEARIMYPVVTFECCGQFHATRSQEILGYQAAVRRLRCKWINNVWNKFFSST